MEILHRFHSLGFKVNKEKHGSIQITIYFIDITSSHRCSRDDIISGLGLMYHGHPTF